MTILSVLSGRESFYRFPIVVPVLHLPTIWKSREENGKMMAAGIVGKVAGIFRPADSI